MIKAKLFHRARAGAIGAATFCVEKLHVLQVTDFGIAIGTRYVITPCDGSCESMPTIDTLELPEELVAEMHELCGKGPFSR